MILQLRNLVNTLKTEENAIEAGAKLEPIMDDIGNRGNYANYNEMFNYINIGRNTVYENLEEKV